MCSHTDVSYRWHVQPQQHAQRRRRTRHEPPRAGGNGGSGAAAGLQEAAAKTKDSLKKAGQSAQQALQDAERQVGRLHSQSAVDRILCLVVCHNAGAQHVAECACKRSVKSVLPCGQPSGVMET